MPLDNKASETKYPDYKPDSEMWGLVWCFHNGFKGTFTWDGNIGKCSDWDSDANRKLIPIWESESDRRGIFGSE